MKKTLTGIGLGLILFNGGLNASATALSTGIDSSWVSSGTLLTAGSYTGTFDITNELQNNGGTYYSPYDITSASVGFNFKEDNDFVSSTSTGAWYTKGGSNRYRDIVTTLTDSVYDKVSVSIGDQQSSTETKNQTYSTSSYQTIDHCWGGGWSSGCYYNNNITTYTGYYSNGFFFSWTSNSPLSVFMSLSAANLEALRSSGRLDFNLGILGDLNFSNAWLAFDINESPAPNAPVPEPATMLLFGTGIASLVAARRRKK
jgi:hypothetical protein